MRLAVAPDLSADSLCGFARTVVDAGAVVHTDAWQGYRPLSRLGYDHRWRSQRAAPAGEWLLPRAHRSISNLKAWLHGTHRAAERLTWLDGAAVQHPLQGARRARRRAFAGLRG